MTDTTPGVKLYAPADQSDPEDGATNSPENAIPHDVDSPQEDDIPEKDWGNRFHDYKQNKKRKKRFGEALVEKRPSHLKGGIAVLSKPIRKVRHIGLPPEAPPQHAIEESENLRILRRKKREELAYQPPITRAKAKAKSDEEKRSEDPTYHAVVKTLLEK